MAICYTVRLRFKKGKVQEARNFVGIYEDVVFEAGTDSNEGENVSSSSEDEPESGHRELKFAQRLNDSDVRLFTIQQPYGG